MLVKLRTIIEKLSPGLRKILGNVGWLFAERILTMIVAFSIGIYVIRYLGSDNFGQLSYSASFVALFGVIAQLGLAQIVIRNLVQEEKASAEILGTAFVLKLIASFATVVLIGGATWWFNAESNTRMMTLIIAGGLLFSGFDVIELWFQSQVLAGILAMMSSAQLILSSLVKLLFISLHFPLMAFVWLLLTDQVVKMLGIIWLYIREDQSILQWRFNGSKALEMLRDSWPLILSGVMVTVYVKIDQVMLGNMANAQAVGNYAVAVRFSEIWYFIPIAVCSSVFPSILRARERSKEEYYFRIQLLYDLMAWMALAIAIPMTIVSVPLMVGLLGKEFAESGRILAWHIWAAPFVFLGVAQSQWLIAENFTRFSFAKTILGAISNIMINLLLIPTYGGVGAAIATMISYGISSHISNIFYPPLFDNGWMITKALFIPFRIRQNLLYLRKITQIINKLR